MHRKITADPDLILALFINTGSFCILRNFRGQPLGRLLILRISHLGQTGIQLQIVIVRITHIPAQRKFIVIIKQSAFPVSGSDRILTVIVVPFPRTVVLGQPVLHTLLSGWIPFSEQGENHFDIILDRVLTHVHTEDSL